MRVRPELEVALEVERRLASLLVGSPALSELRIAPLRGVSDLGEDDHEPAPLAPEASSSRRSIACYEAQSPGGRGIAGFVHAGSRDLTDSQRCVA